jgi:tRNA pseudouridine38-40 synthase
VKNYVLKLQYIGRNFYGFQKQSTAKTVQGEIEKALSLVLQSRVKTNGAARTDRGVNAISQYVNFYFDKSLDVLRIKRKLNAILFSSGIFVKDLFETDLLFHPRKNVKGKIYAYILSENKEKAMFIMPHVYFYNGNFNKELLEIAIKGLKGEHDFSIFANKDRSQPLRSNICNIFDIGMIERPFVKILYFYGNRFLYHMVRRMVYYIIKASTGEIKEKFLSNPFSFDTPYTRQVLPPEPLFLVDIFYKVPVRRIK